MFVADNKSVCAALRAYVDYLTLCSVRICGGPKQRIDIQFKAMQAVYSNNDHEGNEDYGDGNNKQ